jgi:hypothetical protein
MMKHVSVPNGWRVCLSAAASLRLFLPNQDVPGHSACDSRQHPPLSAMTWHIDTCAVVAC